MSKKKSKKTVITTKESQPKGKVVKTTKTKTVKTKNKVSPTVSRSSRGSRSAVSSTNNSPDQLIFNRQNYMWMAIGAGLIALGMIMMLGGKMPSPDVWDESIIYNPRITVLGPILILSGLVVEIYAIFKD